jgi:hypothetical protein
LVSVKWSGIITNAVAILVAAMTPSVFNLLIGPINWLWRKITTMLCEEGRPLQDGGFEYQVLLKWCLHDLLPERVMNFLVGEKTERKPEDPPKIDFVLDRVVLALVLLVLPVCLITASVVSAGLATTSIGVSNSPHCGEWETQFHLDDFMEPFLQFEHATETDSIKYAANCYESNPSSEDCSKFYNESIAYSVEAGIPCQFDGQVCNDMGEGAFKLSTGLVSGSVLGINARNPFLFSRTMTCSPIVTGDKEVTLGLSDQGEEQWQYWYGQSLAEYTWANPVQESPWEIKGYSTSYVILPSLFRAPLTAEGCTVPNLDLLKASLILFRISELAPTLYLLFSSGRTAFSIQNIDRTLYFQQPIKRSSVQAIEDRPISTRTQLEQGFLGALISIEFVKV